MRLLIIEDERTLCDAVSKSLEKDGFEVDVCYTGAEALEKTGADKYDLIILDLNLPRMDGMDILKKLRLNDQETKVLILSARGNAADKIAGLDAGANDYLAKPFHLGELGAQPYEAAVHTARRIPDLRRAVLRYAQQEGGGQGRDRHTYEEGKRHTGIPAAQSGQAGEPGGTHRARMGRQRGCFQQLHKGAYILAQEKAPRGAGL